MAQVELLPAHISFAQEELREDEKILFQPAILNAGSRSFPGTDFLLDAQ
jgi:hypothetical protein